MDNPPDGGATLRTLRSGPGSAVAVLSVGRPSTGTVLPLRGLSARESSLLGPPQSAPAGVRPLGPLPAYTLGGGRQGTGVRPLSQAPASAASQTSRRGAVPAPCTQTLENYSPSLKGARYPSSMGDRLQRPFAGCDTGKPAPGAPPLTGLPPTGPPDAGKGTEWVFLGFGMAGGSRGRPPMAAEPDPVQPLRRRSPHGEVGPTVAVAPPHSGVTDFDFGPGGGLGSEGLDFGYDGVPDPVAAEIRDRHGAYPGLLPGDVPDPDLETRQPAGALDSRDLVSAAVRSPPPRKAVGPALFAGAIRPGQFPGMTTALGPDSASRDLSFLTRATQRSLGGGGGGGVVRGGTAAGLAEQAAVLLSAREEASWQLRQQGDPTSVRTVLQADAAYESVADAYRQLQRQRNIGLSFEKAVARARKRARADEQIRRIAAERVARAEWRRFDARWARFRGISGDARGYDRARAYGQAREDLDRARGDVRNQIRDARNALLDLRGKEDTEATTQRIATLEAALERARLDKDPTAVWMASADLVRFGEFEDLIESAGRAVDRAEEARESYEEAADDLRRASLRGGDIADATKALDEAREEVRKALERLLEVMVLVDEATRAGRPPDPPEDAKGGGKKRKGPRLPWWACSGPNAAAADCKGRKWCPKCGPHEVCVACWWEMVPSSGAGGGKGKVLGRDGASFGGPKPLDESAFQRMADRAPKANIHQLDGRGVEVPPDGPAGGVGAEPAMSTYASAHGPIPFRRSPDENWTKPPQPPRQEKVPEQSAVDDTSGSTAPRPARPNYGTDVYHAAEAFIRLGQPFNPSPASYRQMERDHAAVRAFWESSLADKSPTWLGVFPNPNSHTEDNRAEFVRRVAPGIDPAGPYGAVELAQAMYDKRSRDLSVQSAEGDFSYSAHVGRSTVAALQVGEKALEGSIAAIAATGSSPFLSDEQSGVRATLAAETFRDIGRILGGSGVVPDAPEVPGMGSRLGQVLLPESERQGEDGKLAGLVADVLGVGLTLGASLTPAEVVGEGLSRAVGAAVKAGKKGIGAVKEVFPPGSGSSLGGGGGSAGKGAVGPEASRAGVGDEVTTSPTAAPTEPAPKVPGEEEKPLAPADSSTAPPQGELPKSDAEVKVEEPEDSVVKSGDDCKCEKEQSASNEPVAPEDGSTGSGEGPSSGVPRGPGGTPLTKEQVRGIVEEQFPISKGEDVWTYQKRIADHMEGIDWTKPVNRVPLKAGDKIDVWVRDGKSPGAYGTTMGTSEGLGIQVDPATGLPAGRHLERFVIDREITVVRSTAADFPAGKYPGVGGQGGATQYHLPPEFYDSATRIR